MSSVTVIALLLAVAIHVARASITSSSPIVDLGYVKYRGAYANETDVYHFHGIRYAQAPVGDLRWREPKPIEAQNDYQEITIDTSTFGPACPQAPPPSIPLATATTLTNTSEDCLLLDLYVPANPKSTALPVMINLHGGGYTVGGAPLFSGDGLVHHAKGEMIYGVVQYRLGMFGFLGGSDIHANGVLNTGLLDQKAALLWVQRHISSFGGDPSRVTVYGGSAGGGSVLYQLIANGGSDEPPFSAAISEYPFMQPLMNLSSQDTQYHGILELAGCSNLTCLRSLDSDILQNINARASELNFPTPGYGQGTFYYGPVVDGKFIRQLPSEEIKQGHFQKVPLLVDHSAYEGDIFTNPNITTQVEETQDAHELFPFAGPSFFTRLYNLYPRENFNSTFFQRQAWFGDMIINCPTYQVASAMADRSFNSSAVFKLVFSAGNQLHGATSPFILSTGMDWPGANNKTIAKIMTGYIVSFVVTHDPNPLRAPESPFWSSYLDSGTAMLNGTGNFNVMSVTYNTVGCTQDPDSSPQCDFFIAQNNVVRN